MIRWLLVFWMFVMSAIAYLDRVNLSIAAKSITDEFHLSNVQLGWVFSAFVLGYALFQRRRAVGRPLRPAANPYGRSDRGACSRR